MSEISTAEIEVLLRPYLPQPTADLLAKLKLYLDLLMKWNGRTNLTAIRDPREMVKRHFGESLFAARHVGNFQTLLDYGSGAGFPGLPIALLRPEIAVTLAESQGKKVAFLREAVRVLQVPLEVWAGRVEEMETGRTFECVTLRSVDGMAEAVASAWNFATKEMLVMTTSSRGSEPFAHSRFALTERVSIPDSLERLLLRYIRTDELFHVERAGNQ